jgi:hypothetical protein
VVSVTRRTPTLRDLLEPDARVVCTSGFRPFMGQRIERGSYFRLSDQVVRENPTCFAVVLPLAELEEVK